MDIALFVGYREKMKENKETGQYLDLARELRKL